MDARAERRRTPSAIIHTAYGYDGEEIGIRRSEHSYNYAICHRATGRDGNPKVIVDRWSRTPKCRMDQFAVYAWEMGTSGRRTDGR